MTATSEPACPITDRILKAELRRVIAEHARAVDDWIGRWNFSAKVHAAESSSDPYNEECRMRPDEACLDKQDAAVQAWADYWWRRYLWKV